MEILKYLTIVQWQLLQSRPFVFRRKYLLGVQGKPGMSRKFNVEYIYREIRIDTWYSVTVVRIGIFLLKH